MKYKRIKVKCSECGEEFHTMLGHRFCMRCHRKLSKKKPVPKNIVDTELNKAIENGTPLGKMLKDLGKRGRNARNRYSKYKNRNNSNRSTRQSTDR